MNIKDEQLAHLRNLGLTRTDAINMLEQELERSSDFLEIAEVTCAPPVGETAYKDVGYVAGICGSRDAKKGFDLGDDVYRLVYFKGLIDKEGLWQRHKNEKIFTPKVSQLTSYVPLNNNF